jgi:pyruvate,water dikinase
MASGPHVQDYLTRMGQDARNVRMAVIVQEMVTPRLSGVAFSRNPTSGAYETVIEAVQGPGTMLVQEGVSPLRWIVRGGQVMAAPQPDPVDPVLIREIAAQTRTIATRAGEPVDLEWVWDGSDLYWVQMRPITALRGQPLYSSRIARDMLPGMIKPLVWSINIPLVNGAWIRLLTELIGPNNLDPQTLAHSFYYRTYFNLSEFAEIFSRMGLPEDSLEMMMGIGPSKDGMKMPAMRISPQTLRLLPRMLVCGLDKARFERKVDKYLPSAMMEFRRFARMDRNVMSNAELLKAVDDLFKWVQECAYYNIVGPMLMFLYNAMLRASLKDSPVDYESLDLLEGVEAARQFNPAWHLKHLNGMYQKLDDATRQAILVSTYPEFHQELAETPGLDEFRRETARFIDQFGHLSDSGNDCSVPPWRESPELILKMIAGFEGQERRNGQRGPADLHQTGWRRWLISSFFRRAQRYRLLREQIGSLYTYGYGQFRGYFLELGRRCVQEGRLNDPLDIFFLELDEVRAMVKAPHPGESYLARAAARRLDMEAMAKVLPPETIFGTTPPPAVADSGRRLNGIATSRGSYFGPARIVLGISDFHKVRRGDVLVMPYSDVGWSPLFVRAGAVVSDSGGILSHASIIAREYGIPAVVSVANATSLIHDGQIVMVDGFSGEVLMDADRSSRG